MSRKKWYEKWFDRDEYEIVYRHRDTFEARQLIDLIERITGVQPAARIADIGCGRGRHAISLAQRGYRVTGLDLSERSIEAARNYASLEGQAIEFIVGDMRDPICDSCFDGAVNLFTAFGYFEDEAEHDDAIAAVARSLKAGGWFVQDFLNPPYVRQNLVAEDRRNEEDLVITQRRYVSDGRINKEIELSRNGDEVHVFSESVRLLELSDFRRMYDAAGLQLRGLFGDYGGGEYGAESPRMILYSRKG